MAEISCWRFGEFEFDASRKTLRRGDDPVRLEPRVLQLLEHLLRHADQLVSKTQLLEQVWSTPHVTDWAISRAVADLRRVLREHGGDGAWIVTVHGRGYRWQGPLRTETTSTNAEFSRLSDRPTLFGVRRWSAPLLLLAAVATLGLYWSLVPPRPDLAQPHLLVIPPTAGESVPPWMALGLADDVINRLAHQAELRVLSRGIGERVAASETDRTARAEELGADQLLELSLRPLDGGLLASARLIRTSDAVVIWAEQYRSVEPRVSSLAEQIGADVITTLLRRAPRAPARPISTAAEVAFLRGRHLLQRRGREDLAAAQGYFSEAVALDPEYAPAWAGQAATHLLTRIYFLEAAEVAWPLATTAAERALALDPQLADAHAVLGLLAVNRSWDFDAARRHYEHALTLAPSQLSALQWSAELAMFEGRDEDAVRWIEQAMSLDPASPVLIGIAGMIEAARGQRTSARARFAEALRLEPQFVWLYRELAYLAEWEGRPAEAVAARIQEMRLRGTDEADLHELLRATSEQGPAAYYGWFLEQHEHKPGSPSRVPQELTAEALAALGRHDEAALVLRRFGAQMGEALPHFLIRSPAFKDPRYRALAQELGLRGLRPPPLPSAVQEIAQRGSTLAADE